MLWIRARHVVPAALLALALASSASPRTASAAPVAVDFPPLLATVQARIDAINAVAAASRTPQQRAQLAALTRAKAALNAKALTLTAEVASAQRVVAALEVPLAADAEIPGELTSMVTSLALTAQARGTLLTTRAALMPDKPQRTTAASDVTAGDATIAGAINPPSPTTLAARMKLVGAALKTYEAGNTLADRFTFGVVRDTATGDSLTATAGTLGQIQAPAASTPFTLRYATNGAFLIDVTGTVGATTAHVSLIVATPGRGGHAIQAGPPLTLANGSIQPAPCLGGTIYFSVFDPVHKKAAGRFVVRFSDPMNTVDLTDGTFSTVNLDVQ